MEATDRLSSDHWFVQNTLPYVLPYLNTHDILRCSRVCKLWDSVCRSTPWYTVSLDGRDVDCQLSSETMIRVLGRNETKKLVMSNITLEMINEKTMDTTERLSSDHWFVQNTLPYVLPYLNTNDILRCSRVCKLWDSVCRSTPWYTVSLDGRDVDCQLSSETMIRVLGRNETKKLVMSNITLEMINEKRLNHDFVLRNIEHLVIEDSPLAIVHLMLSICPNIQKARITLLPTSPAGPILDLAIFHKSSRCLSELRINCCRGIRINNTQKFPNLKSLYLLQVERVLLDNDDIDVNWENMSQLETLALGHMDSICEKVTSISPLKNLRTLILDKYAYVNDNLLYHIRTLENLTTVMFLEIYTNVEFLLELSSCRHIENLVLVSRPHKYLMPKFNQDVIEAVKHFKHLKCFSWGFFPRALEYSHCKVNEFGQESVYFSNKDNADSSSILLDFLCIRSIIVKELNQTVVNVSAYNGCDFKR